jgi:hypothetical protein
MINQEPPFTGRNCIPSNWKRSSPGIMSIFFVTLKSTLLSRIVMVVALTKVARGASALAEIVIVVTIIALFGAMALAGFLCARKHRKSTEIRRTLPLADSAVDRYAP